MIIFNSRNLVLKWFYFKNIICKMNVGIIEVGIFFQCMCCSWCELDYIAENSLKLKLYSFSLTANTR